MFRFVGMLFLFRVFSVFFFFFFFQAEDGIRDLYVTGVQTCALPISTERLALIARQEKVVIVASLFERRAPGIYHNTAAVIGTGGEILGLYRKRSEERRVGKECRCRRSTDEEKEKVENSREEDTTERE